jgi:hypothetical protein
MIHQVSQDVKRSRSQRDFVAASAQQPALHVQSEIAKRVLAPDVFSRMWPRAAQPSLSANTTARSVHQLFHEFSGFFHRVSLLRGTLWLNLLLTSGKRLSQKEQLMKRITKITLFALGLAGLGPLAGLQPIARAAGETVLTLDVAIDCRTLVAGPNRGDLFILSGKIFPGGTLTGVSGNNPTEPVNGVAPIGDWTIRGQNGFPFPPAIAAAYKATPFQFGTAYFILNDGRALTIEGYLLLPSFVVLSSVTGGIGGFSGAAGDAQSPAPSTFNATGCPNGRTTFRFQPGSVRGASNN